MGGRDTAGRPLFGFAGIVAAVGLGASAARHIGWWLEWQLRAHPGEGCRELEEEGPLPPSLSAETAA